MTARLSAFSVCPSRFFLLLAALGLASGAAWAQVGIGTTAPSSKAALEITAPANDKGLLIPRLTQAQRRALLNPPQGLMVFQTGTATVATDSVGFWYATGAAGSTGTGKWLYLPDKTNVADNLGNHTATSTLNLNGNLLYGTNASRIEVYNRTGVSPLTLQAVGTTAASFFSYNPAGTSLQITNNTGREWDLISSGIFNSEGAGHLLIRDAGNSAVRAIFRSDGRMGLGTVSPQAMFHVAGDARIEALAGTDTRMVTADASGNLGSTAVPADAQQLSLSGQTLSLTGGGSVELPSNTAEITTAGNGLTLSGTQVQLGGTLSQATTVDQGNNFLAFTNGQLGIGISSSPSNSRLTVAAGSASENGLQVRLSGSNSAANSLKLEHFGSNLTVRPATAGGSTTVVENSAGALSLNPGGGAVGVGVTPTSTLHVAGSEAKSIVTTGTISGVFALTGAHRTLRRTSTSCTGVQLPQPGTCVGRVYTIINALSAVLPLTVSTSGTVKDDAFVTDYTTPGNPGTASVTVSSLQSYTRLTVQSDGTDWIVLSR
ncbi:hypothetical protein FY528_06830 [Hymenobacter lutimineralis]|uniref:Uncharacterized protein n=1 Tax=Hymenobacter lutimineralis TaxID=2606448 RepID=A0A5D6V9R0_9BACT|nr:hypothetical protein [Hymenobacter lutimineralis]TYZ11404.1 hypothetical protein FY528_06830 [Hymenobacter lutimineralis]